MMQGGGMAWGDLGKTAVLAVLDSEISMIIELQSMVRCICISFNF